MSSIISTLQEKLGSEKVLTGEAVKERFNHIWLMHIPLNAKAVVMPRSTEDISLTLKICNKFNQPVVVHGGLTNLVGSTETNSEEVVISMEKMNLIEEIDEKSRTMTVQAGVILEAVQNAAKEKDLLFPLNFGAKGSAQIGGAISTNAGGLRVFKYGMTRSLVLGLEAVLADGTVISSLKKIIKDNSAYDIKQLFIGSEGTLGVITKAVLKLVEAPRSRNSAFVGINDYEKVIEFLKYMDASLAGTLSGYELIWNRTFQAFTTPPATMKPPLPYDYKYYVLLESLGSNQEKDNEIFQNLLENALEKELILDAVIANTESDLKWFWTIREDVHPAVGRFTADQHFDVSLPIPLIGDYVNEILEKIKGDPEIEGCLTFGHVADGNIHFIFGKPDRNQALTDKINEMVYRPLEAIGGSVSAEHGIGSHKKTFLSLCRTEAEIQLMKTLKKVMDPKNILNRGKVI
ncbi:MAG: FAD-binding oxidoreductase [Bacteroidetes bacterium]|jgi:FAD/FMN-containing dehydrogenase|nr:FAD-binding oxidoreductase [Bacteroidota bacterium]MDF1863333.1 FAD-binding oxidoreductase [Saprospiraceae bacterium]